MSEKENIPLVSIVMITYNHEEFIEEAIRSILEQKIDFHTEFLISNDASSDRTHELIEKLISQYNGNIEIRYFNQEKNLGMMRNFIFALSEAKGKYIALCEGDDFWIDEQKIKKQKELLDKELDYSLCFHDVKVFDSKNGQYLDSDISNRRFSQIKSSPIKIDHLLKYGNFIHTPSVMFRRDKMVLPSSFVNSSVGDYFLYVILAQNGFIYRMNDKMAVYRRGVGVYSSQNSQIIFNKMINYNLLILNHLSDPSQKEILSNRIQMLIADQVSHLNQSIDKLERSSIENAKFVMLIKQMGKLILRKSK